MSTQTTVQGVTTLTHPFYLSKNDLEGIKGLSGAGSMLAMEALTRAKEADPLAMPPKYVTWSQALDKACPFLREVDFRLKLAERTHPQFALAYNFTPHEVLSLSNLHETGAQLLELINEVTKHLLSDEFADEQKAELRIQLCNLYNNYQYHVPNARAFIEAIENETKRLMETDLM